MSSQQKPALVQEFQDNRCTYEIHAFFGETIKLEDILARRVLRDLENYSSENEAETACLSANSEVY